MQKILKKIDIKLIIYILFIAIICITICSKNSFLYCFNDWEDENAFMTVAKGWINGLIPYRDLFEQKGPLLYLIFVIANLIHETSFIGVYILEIISMAITLFIVAKIIKMFLDVKYQYIILPLFCSIITSSIFFSHGGSAEEFCLPFFVYGLYNLLKYFKTNEITEKGMFLSGLCAGIIAMIKFNLLGFYIGFCLSIGISMLIKKETKLLFKKALFFLMGMLLPIIVFVIYLKLNNALDEFIDIYLIYNTKSYGVQYSFYLKILISLTLFCIEIIVNKIVLILIMVGLIRFIQENKISKEKVNKILFVMTFILSFVGIYYGGLAYNYYFLFMLPYIVFGLIIIYNVLPKIKTNKGYLITLTVSIIISSIFLISSNNLSFMKVKKEDLVQYKFAEIINTKEEATILNYGFLDGGFYMASNILPNTRYFEKQNGDMRNYYEVMEREISDKRFDYIVIMNYNEDDEIPNYIEENYQLIQDETQEYENNNYYFLLYEKK